MFLLYKFFPNATLTTDTERRTSKRMFHRRVLKRGAKLYISIFSLITISAIIFLIHDDGVIYHDSLEVLQGQSHRNEEEIKSTLALATHIALRSMQEQRDGVDKGSQRVLIAPLNVTEEERIAWFRGNLHEFKILKSNNLTRQFHARVQGFFNHDHQCESQFFMTWISPASSFGAREFFCLETLFKVHPGACLVILSRTLDSTHGHRILKPLLDRGFRVQAVSPDFSFLLKGTPAEAWFHQLRKGKKDPGLRNCIGAQSMDLGSKQWTRLNIAILIFDMNHPLLLRFIHEFALTFDGNKWGHNGPYMVSRVVAKLGKSPGFKFTILPPVAFYPVDWLKIGGFFRKPKTQGEAKWVDAKLIQLSGESYGIHLWNKQSSRFLIEEGSVIARLVSEHCVICNSL
ncbi:uncharacterized protein At4g19900-like isoform X2 [Lotus japonicus]|uniref:uncharacterized protein At4g19900-like isoform X2 n=1 Tax=Lotus japonicus TaxID=34305 RepID=UPI0025831906|nr:uncharacterized protein At4g19900-like isoform X2 [Lotus japonicus]